MVKGGGGDIHFDSLNVYLPKNTLLQSKLLASKLGSVPTRRVPESNHLSGQRWHSSEVLLAQRRQMTLARCHLMLIGPTSLPTVGSMLVQRPLPNKPCICQRNANHSLSSIALGQRWPDMIYGHHLLILIV